MKSHGRASRASDGAAGGAVSGGGGGIGRSGARSASSSAGSGGGGGGAVRNLVTPNKSMGQNFLKNPMIVQVNRKSVSMLL